MNTCKNRLQQAARRRSTDLADRQAPSGPDHTSAVHDRLQIEEGLARLKPDERIVLALRYYRDLKVEEIAELLGIPPGTATSRLHNAHIRLRGVIERSGQEGATR